MWCYAIEWSARLKNRRPTKALPFGTLTGITPVEAYRGRPESLSNVRVFGSIAVPLHPPGVHQRKFQSRTIPGAWICVGMVNSATYKLLNVENFKEMISVDVKFNEYATYEVQVGVQAKAPEKKTVERPLVEGPAERPSIVRPVTSAEKPVGRPTPNVESSKRPLVESQRVALWEWETL